MAFTALQYASGNTGTTSTPVVFGSNVALGSLLVVVANWGSSSATSTASVTDSLGNKYVPVGSPLRDGSNNDSGHAWWCISKASGACTITVAYSANFGFYFAQAAEFANALGFALVGAVGVLTAANAAASSGSVAGAPANSLVVGAWQNTGSTTLTGSSVGSGFTSRGSGGEGGANGMLESKLDSGTAGAQAATFSTATAGFVWAFVFGPGPGLQRLDLETGTDLLLNEDGTALLTEASAPTAVAAALAASVTAFGDVSTATLTTGIPLAAAATAGSDVSSASLATGIPLAASASAAGDVTAAALSAQTRFAATASAVGDVTVAVLATAILLLASVTAVGDVSSAALSTGIPFAASVSAAGDLGSAPLTTAIPLAASLTAAGNVSTAALTTAIPLGASATAAGDVSSASLTAAIRLAASATAAGDVSAASLSTAIRLAGSLTGAGDVTAAGLTTGIRLAAALTSAGDVAASLTTSPASGGFAASLTAAGDVTATLSAQARFAAIATAAGDVAATLATGIPLAASVTSAAAVSAASLTVGALLASAVTATGDGFATLAIAITLAASITASGDVVVGALLEQRLYDPYRAQIVDVLVTAPAMDAARYAAGARDSASIGAAAITQPRIISPTSLVPSWRP